MSTDFGVFRRTAPPIHVFGHIFAPCDGEVTILKPSIEDTNYEDRRYSEGEPGGTSCILGDGTRNNPYRYRSAANVSPHYAIVDLWFRFREYHVFINVNDWILEISFDGVTAADGHFTKLS